jgi:hypothetical protein|tara:strand:+ start:244 stop:492 length:249 start_codon:yes stop_codon:yes gene_type:complete
MAKTVRTSGAYTLQPTTEVVTLKNGLLFTPVAFANLPSTPAMGMVAFLTTDGAGSTKNKLCYYETANNRWNYVDDNSAVATS